MDAGAHRRGSQSTGCRVKRPTARSADVNATSPYASARKRVLGGSERPYAVIITKEESGKRVEFSRYDDEPSATHSANFLKSLGCRAEVTGPKQKPTVDAAGSR